MKPNLASLHRLVGVAAGILESTTTLSEADHLIGHRRVYTIEHLLADLRAAGFRPLHWEGVFLKPLSNSQMLGWGWELIRAFNEVGRQFPATCATLYVVATPGLPRSHDCAGTLVGPH